MAANSAPSAACNGIELSALMSLLSFILPKPAASQATTKVRVGLWPKENVTQHEAPFRSRALSDPKDLPTFHVEQF